MAVAGFIAIVSFPYRDAPEEWSQGYHIADAWVDDADFHAAMDDFRVGMADVVSARTTFERFIRYDDFSPGHMHTSVYDISGSALTGALDTTGLTPMPGDVAFWARWKMARLSTRGKPVYLRKYFHDAYATEDGDPDRIASTQQTAAAGFAASLYAGLLNGHLIADRLGVRPTNEHTVSDWLTTRTLERRGRRPTPP